MNPETALYVRIALTSFTFLGILGILAMEIFTYISVHRQLLLIRELLVICKSYQVVGERRQEGAVTSLERIEKKVENVATAAVEAKEAATALAATVNDSWQVKNPPL